MANKWVQASRPKTLLAGVCPVIIGTSMAYRDGGFYLPAALAALAGALAIQIGTNFCNDYFDFRQGADTTDRKGPTRAVQAGLISPEAMLKATVLMFAIAGLISLYLVWRAGWPLAIVGALSILFGVLYTAGRYSLAYLGLGDLFVLVFFGPVAVAGTYYVQKLELDWPIVVAGLAPGLMSAGILVINNLRDVDEDRAAHKRTLVVRFGVIFGRLQYLICMVGTAAIPYLLIVMGYLPTGGLIASLMLAPGIGMAARLGSVDGKDLNPFLYRTALVLLGYTFIFSLGCLFAW